MHVRSLITPFIDHELDEVITAQVRDHLQNCASCMELYQAELSTHSLTAVSTDALELPADLNHRLLELPRAALTAKGGQFAESHCAPRARLLVPLMGLSLILAVIAVGGLLGLGHYQWSQRTVTPYAVSSDFAAHSHQLFGNHQQAQLLNSPDSAASDSAQQLLWLHDEGWVAPESLPAGMELIDVVVHDAEHLEFMISDSADHVLRIGERIGHLDTNEVADWLTFEVGNYLVYDDGTGLWFLQCGSHVVMIDSKDARVSAKSLIESLPSQEAESPFLSRILGGWRVVAAALIGQ